MILDAFSFTPLEISIAIVAFSAILYYFGRIIADTHVEQADKPVLYVAGFIFVGFFILVPGGIVYYIKDYLAWIPKLTLLLLQIVMFSMLSWAVKTYEYFLKHGLLDVFQEKYREKLEEIKKDNALLGNIIAVYETMKNNKDPVSTFSSILEANRKISSNYLFLMLVSTISIFSLYRAISENSLIFIASTSVLGFFLFTMMALVYGFSTAYYPPAVIHLKNGEILQGKLLKFGDFVYLLDPEQKVKIFINKQEIMYLEESLFKNQFPISQSKDEVRMKTLEERNEKV